VKITETGKIELLYIDTHGRSRDLLKNRLCYGNIRVKKKFN